MVFEPPRADHGGMDTTLIVRKISTAGFVLAALSGAGIAVAGFAQDPSGLPLTALAAAPAVFFLGAVPFVLYRLAARTASTAAWSGGALLFFTAMLHLMTHAALSGTTDGMELLGFVIATVWGAVIVGGASLAESMSSREAN